MKEHVYQIVVLQQTDKIFIAERHLSLDEVLKVAKALNFIITKVFVSNLLTPLNQV